MSKKCLSLFLVILCLFASACGKAIQSDGNISKSESPTNAMVTVDNVNSTITGEVSFDVTLADFVENYNAGITVIAQSESSDSSYIETRIRLLMISVDDFERQEFESEGVIKYTYMYETYRGGAGLMIYADKESDKLIEVELVVSSELYGSSEETTVSHWLTDIPFCVFYCLDEGYYNVFSSMDGNIAYEKGCLYMYGIADNLLRMGMFACTKDSETYRQIINE